MNATQSQQFLRALLPVCLQLDDARCVVQGVGDVARFFGLDSAEIVGRDFSHFLSDADRQLWHLALHKISRKSHVGPIPFRLRPGQAPATAVDLHLFRADDMLWVGVTPYLGQINFGAAARPAADARRRFIADDFAPLVARIKSYAGEQGVSATAALLSLAGIDRDASETSLLTLYTLLSDAGTEGASTRQSLARQSLTRQSATENKPSAQQAMPAPSKPAPPRPTPDVMRGEFTPSANNLPDELDTGISEAEAVKAAVYALQRAANKGQTQTMKALSGGYEKRVAQARTQLKAFKQIVVQEHFDVHLQPIVDINSEALHHFEALARFDPKFFAGSPFEFMCFAEEIGVIHEFDLAMTMKVISLMKRMKRIGYPMSVAVNISGKSVQSPAFLRQFFRVLEDCGDLRNSLLFELTESSQIDDLETTNRILTRIRDFGHKVCLDDFGAGAAGLQYLRVLKVDYVKIDGIYIRKGISDPENRSFLRSMADLCNTLGIKTVGECVEDADQRDFLRGIGVSYAQGWLYGKPVAVDDALQYLP